jgi:hypothetical protein
LNIFYLYKSEGKPPDNTTVKPFENYLKQAFITIMRKQECADFLKARQICAGETSKPVRDACQVI